MIANVNADRVKAVAKLSSRSARTRANAFLCEGPQVVREALKAQREARAGGAGALIEQIFATPDCLDTFPELTDLAEGVVQIRRVTQDVLARMSTTVSPQGVVAVCSFVDVSLETVFAGKPSLLAVMCRTQDPGNAGTIIRAADSAGADAVVLTRGSVDVYNPKTIRSTVGSIFHLPVVVAANFDDIVEACKQAGVGILAADGYGALNLDQLQDESAARSFDVEVDSPGYALERPSAWLFGNEAQGLSNEELSAAEARVAVPLYGQAESLNVSTAATVCLYASARAQQRGVIA